MCWLEKQCKVWWATLKCYAYHCSHLCWYRLGWPWQTQTLLLLIWTLLMSVSPARTPTTKISTIRKRSRETSANHHIAINEFLSITSSKHAFRCTVYPVIFTRILFSQSLANRKLLNMQNFIFCIIFNKKGSISQKMTDAIEKC